MTAVKKTQYLIWELSLSSIIGLGEDQFLSVDNKTLRPSLRIGQKYLPMVGKRLSHADCIAFQQLRRLGDRSDDDRGALLQDILILDFKGAGKSKRLYLPNLHTEDDGTVKRLRPRGVSVDEIQKAVFADGLDIEWESERIHYSHFGSSASMTRSGQQVFVREEREQALSERVTLGLLKNGRPTFRVSGFNISKWGAYKGLSLSDGWDIHALAKKAGVSLPALDSDSVLIIPDLIIDKEHYSEKLKALNEKNKAITFNLEKNKAAGGPIRLQSKHDPDSFSELNLTDGVGLIDPEFAKTLDALLGGSGEFRSFQLRMPFVKGMVHSVDFKGYLKEKYPGETLNLEDIDGNAHPLDGIRMILPQSMFKCRKWFDVLQPKNGVRLYFDRFNSDDYQHHLFVSQKNRAVSAEEDTVRLNYQVLQTCGIRWEQLQEMVDESLLNYFELGSSPEARLRCLLHNEAEELRDEEDISDAPQDMDDADSDADEQETGQFQTEAETRAEAEARIEADVRAETQSESEASGEDVETPPEQEEPENEASAEDPLLRAVSRHHGLAEVSPQCCKRLKNRRQQILFRDLLHGRVEVPGTGRYLCCDLMQYLAYLAQKCTTGHTVKNAFPEVEDPIPADSFYAPGFHSDSLCALYRNPHYSENEHLLLKSFQPQETRSRYLKELTGVLMLPYDNMGAMRLGGADFDGDHVSATDARCYVDALKRTLCWSEEKTASWVGSGLDVVNIPDLGIKGETLKTEDLTAALLTEKERDAFFRSMNNQIGKISFKAFRTAFFGPYPTAFFTAYGGCEIDSVKKGYTMSLPKDPEGKGPFLRIVKDNKLSKNSTLSALKKALNTHFDSDDTDWSSIDEPEANPNLCLLDYLPIYLYTEAGSEKKVSLISKGDTYATYFDLPALAKQPDTEELNELSKKLLNIYNAYQYRMRELTPGYVTLPFTTWPDTTLVRLLMPRADSGTDAQEKLDACRGFFSDLDDTALQEIDDALKACVYELTDAQERQAKLEQCLSIMPAHGGSVMDELQDFRNDGFALSYCLLRVAHEEQGKRIRQLARMEFQNCATAAELADATLESAAKCCREYFSFEAPDRETVVAASLIRLIRSNRISLEKMLWDADLTGKAAERLLKSAEGGKEE